MTPGNEPQPAQLARVGATIGDTVAAFCRARFAMGLDFYADDLREFVREVHPTAPASADRILRDLRSKGVIGYVVVSRAYSRYRITSVSGAQASS